MRLELTKQTAVMTKSNILGVTTLVYPHNSNLIAVGSEFFGISQQSFHTLYFHAKLRNNI